MFAPSPSTSTKKKASTRAVAQVERDLGRLDILINNAGVLLDDYSKKVSEQSLDTWRATFQTNVFGVVATTQAFLPLLRPNDAGRIVNVSGILGSITYHATPGSPVYDFKKSRLTTCFQRAAIQCLYRAAGL